MALDNLWYFDAGLGIGAVLLLIVYHIYFVILTYKRPFWTSVGLNNASRQQWVSYIMRNESGSPILAVQTLRNTIQVAT